MPMISIKSDSIIPTEHHFRVSAGPGAGKTHWLVNHIKNVLHNSARLGKSRKVACITFTNTAVDTILGRLKTTVNQVEVSTIHSFLYKHIVKPYASFLAEDYGLNVHAMDGHDDTVLSNYSFLREWKIKTRQQRIHEDKLVVDAFKSLSWRFSETGALIVRTDYPRKVGRYSITNDSYLVYKRMAWEKGVVHHDDVLFFSYQLIDKYPFILNVLRAKFPYFFVDEFQDTNPIQVKIMERIGTGKTVVGIIGDSAQSIYSFQGADSSLFYSFNLSNMVDYVMKDNRRSTDYIIDVLNAVRSDIKQEKFRREKGNKPIIIVGDMHGALSFAKKESKNEPVCSLSRKVLTSNLMRKEIKGTEFNNKLIEELLSVDSPSSSNKYRSQVVVSCLKATEFALESNFNGAIKELERIFKEKKDKDSVRKEALRYVYLLISQYEKFKDKSLLEFHSFIKGSIKPDISNFAKGAAKTFYESNRYQQLALCVKIEEDASRHKTIHKAKGDEFKNVLVVLEDESNIDFLLKPNLIDDEEQRINYVAISRARDRLFINVPTLSKIKSTKLESMFEVVNI